MKIITPRNTIKTNNKERVQWNVNLGEQQVVFNPVKSTEHMHVSQIYKILTKTDVDVTKETDKGYVNFKFKVGNSVLGFLNFFENDLDEDSTAEEVSETLTELVYLLERISIDDIYLPLTAEKADSLVDNL